MTLIKILTVSVFLIITATVTVAQEWVVDRVVQPAHYTLDFAPEEDAPKEKAQLLLVAARRAEQQWVTLAPGMTVPNASWVRTGDTGRLQLRRGEEMIEFKPGTTASILSWEHDGALLTHVRQSVGSLFLKVETRDTKHTMVETPVLAALVKGTRFSVEYDEVRAVLRVDHGIVEAFDKTRGERVDVRAQQTVQVSSSNPESMTVQGSGPKDEVTKLALPPTASGEESPDQEEEGAASEGLPYDGMETEEEAASEDLPHDGVEVEEEAASEEVTALSASGSVETNGEFSSYASDGARGVPVASGRDAMALWQTTFLKESQTERLAALLIARLEQRFWEPTQVPLAARPDHESSGDAGEYWILDAGVDDGTNHLNITETVAPSVDIDHVPPASADVADADIAETTVPRVDLDHVPLALADVADADITETTVPSSVDIDHVPQASADVADANVAETTVHGVDVEYVSLASADVADAGITETTVPSVDIDHVPLASADVADTNLVASGAPNPPATSLSDPGFKFGLGRAFPARPSRGSRANFAAATSAIGRDASPDYILTAAEFMASLHSEYAAPTKDPRKIVSPTPAVDVPAVPLPAPALLLIGALFSLPAIRSVRDRKPAKNP